MACKRSTIFGTLAVILILGLFAGIILWTATIHFPAPSKDPTFTVESTTVNSYNLTSDGRLLAAIDIGIRVRNPNSNSSCFFFDFHKTTLQVIDGRPDSVLGEGRMQDFGLSGDNDTLVHVEVVGVDVAASQGRVNVSMTGRVGVYGSFLDVMCIGVAVNVSQSTNLDQKVDCNVTLTIPMPRKLPPCPDDGVLKVDHCILYRKDAQMDDKISDRSEYLNCTQFF